MASLKTQLPEDFMQKLSRLEHNTDVIVPRVLASGGEVVLEHVRDNLEAAIGHGTKYPSRSTGELVAALGVSPAKVNRRGDHDVRIGFREPRRRGKGVTNAKIANILEHGKSGQPPRPFLRRARVTSRVPATQAMVDKLDEEIRLL